MKRIALCVLALLVACNDDDKKDSGTKVQTGQFVDSAVQHLHYQTETQSGETDADGHFSYLAGETITFSIGGVVIGTVPAGATITPFNIFSVTPPNTLADFESLLADERHENVTDFARVVNLALFFQSIDADSNPENGIDLTGRAEAYANASLTFSTPVAEFASNVLPTFIQLYGGGNQKLSAASVLTHLYNTLQIGVAFDVVSTQTYDSKNNGMNDEIEVSTYDANGRLATYTRKDIDGTSILYEVFTYDTVGNVTTDFQSSGPDAAGGYHDSYNRAYTYTNGINTKQSFVSTRDGATRNTSSATFTVDASGRVTQKVEEYQDIEQHSIYTTAIAYDPATRTVTETVSKDVDANGTADEYEINSRTVDTHGNEIASSHDDDGNGQVESSVTTAFTYDANARIIQSMDERKDGAGNVTYRNTRNLTYDSTGHLTASRDITDQYGTGANLVTGDVAYTYDGAGHLTLVTQSTTNGGAAGPSYRDELSYTATGRIASDKTTYKRADNSIIVIYTYGYTYEAGSDHLLSQRFDNDPGGTGDDLQTDVTTYAYTRVTNGLNALLSLLGIEVT